MKIAVPLKMKVRGTMSLGPKPGTPEFEEEQRARAERAEREQKPPPEPSE